MNQGLSYREPQAAPVRTVHVVDDDPSVLLAMARLLRLNDFDVVTHESATGFLGAYERDQPGCALVDVAMPAMDGLALQAALGERDGPPVVFLSGVSDVPTCARAMRNGAVDFLRKPVDELQLVRALENALQRDADARARRRQQRDVQARLHTLTPREAEVLGQVMEGRLNKQIAYDLAIAEKTVKVHRARAMEKMGVRSVAELVRRVERSAAAGPERVA
jgi:FixJ family two-component response regulator